VNRSRIALSCFAAAATALACGARTPLNAVGAPDASAVACSSESDCPSDDACNPQTCIDGFCGAAPPIKCDDGDPCTDDVCDKGACTSRPASLDLDGDGHRGPRPGTKPGAPDSCGDDCDDTSPLAFPGNREVCDGVDNDCNGVVDDGAQYRPDPSGPDAVRVSTTALSQAYPGGIAHDEKQYFASYTGLSGGKDRLYGSLLDQTGKRVGAGETRLSQVESDAFASSVVWTGDRYGTVWSDRRTGQFDVFFAMFDRDGRKMQPGEVSLVSSQVFSINASLVWTGAEFVAVWQEGQGDTQSFEVIGQRIDINGVPLDEGVKLTKGGGESPSLVAGQPGLGLTYGHTSTNNTREVWFQPLDFTLKATGAPVLISSQGEPSYAQVQWNAPNFAVVWTDTSGQSKVWGALVDGKGTVTVPAKPITDSPRSARDPALIPLGDRFLLVYADSRDGNGGFELYSRMLDAKLGPGSFGSPARITRRPGDSTNPIADLGINGDVAVLFRDDRDSSPQTFFTRLVCAAGK
jgi:hypothetical protein